MKKFLSLLCAITSLLALPQQAHAVVRLLDFEGLDFDIQAGSIGTFTTYGGLNWANGHPNPQIQGWINVMGTGQCSSPCGFVNGTTSGVQVATQIQGMTSTISRADPFQALSVQLTSAWRIGEQVTFTGFLNNAQVWSANYVLGSPVNGPLLVNFDSGLINELRVFSTGGQLLGLGGSSAGAVLDDFRYDDLTRAGNGAVPEPATWAMMLAGFGLIGAAMRRPRRPIASAFSCA